MSTVDPDIFKAYDIRGLYGSQLDGDTAELIARAFVRVLADLRSKPASGLRVGLGHDMRLTAPELAARYRAGMVAEGAHVIDAGQVGTEMLYHLVGSRSLDGGLMCTASHNPPAYTGAKLVRDGAIALSGDTGIQDIRRLIESGLQEAPGGSEGRDTAGRDTAGRDAAGRGATVKGAGRGAEGGGENADERSATRGSAEDVDLYAEFHELVLGFIDPAVIRSHPERAGRPLRVVLDGGNGMAGPMIGPALERLRPGLELIETCWTPDGTFPDHEPNPLLPENRAAIISRVRDTGADLGIAWDGDADRCFFIDDQGSFVDGDFLTALLASSLLSKNDSPSKTDSGPGPGPGSAGEADRTILYDVRASRAVPDTVLAAGGIPHINRVGHAFFKTRMRAEGSLFGGEVSGHYYFRDFYCADSGSIPALLILELLCRTGRSMSELLAPLRSRYFISGEINSEVSDQTVKMDELAARYADAEQSRLDGISIDYPDWHFNVRPSNTEPLLRLCLESLVSHEDMIRRRDEVLALIRS